MGFLDKLKQMGDSLTNDVKKYANKDFMNAATASAALFMIANGRIGEAEKTKMRNFFDMNESLKVFNATDILESFTGWTEKVKKDPELGKMACLEAVAKCKSNNAQARTLLRLACAMASADGKMEPTELIMVKAIANELGLDPTEFLG